MSGSPYFVDVELIQIEKNLIILRYAYVLLDHWDVAKYSIKFCNARQFWDTIFKILRVLQYRISSILSQPVYNIRFIECYLVPDHQEVVKYM